MKTHFTAAAICAAAVCATPSRADEITTFRSPTGNINCLYLDVGGDPEMRCDIMQFTSSFKTVPPGAKDEGVPCKPSLLRSYTITRNGSGGTTFCSADGVNDPSSPVLAYGQSFVRAGLTCRSETSGMTCTNAAGHGFFVSKAKQTLF